MTFASSSRAVLALLLAGATSALVVGCSANVTVNGSCEHDGEAYDVGATFDAGDGCNTCTCEEGGAVSCTLLDCEPCLDGEPDCGAPPPGCTLTYECVEGSVQCVVECDDCDEPPPFACDSPPGCYYTGPECFDGNWSCGELICEDPCAGPIPECDQPGSPNCEAYPTCTEFGWECIVECANECDGPPPPCAAPPPNCETYVECSEFGWECVTECVMPDCVNQYPEGYTALVHEVFQTCGCATPSPCADLCAMDEACETLDWSSTCGSCIAEVVTDGSSCVDDAAFGDVCGSNPECAGYVECALASQ